MSERTASTIPEPFETAKVKLITIVAPQGLAAHLTNDLRALGVSGFTTEKAAGWGGHGARQFGLVDSANIRVETLVSAELAKKILEHTIAKFSDHGVVAFMHAVEAVPRRHFV